MAVVGIGVVGWAQRAAMGRAPPGDARGVGWDVAVSSGAAEPVPALVFGWGTGLHVVTLHGTGAPQPAGARVAAQLPMGGAVYVLSLGAAPVEARARVIGEAAITRPAHRARFMRVFQHADGSGVRTVSY